MFNRPTAPLDTAIEPSPDQQQLLRLNVDFLKLMMAAYQAKLGNGLQQQLSLPSVPAVLLAQCQEAALQRMAACNFSLFSLSLHQPDIWQRAAAHSVLQNNSLANTPHYNLSLAAPAHADELSRVCSGFMECALFFTWHLAQRQSRNAYLLLGMSEECAAIVARLELWQCRHIAHHHSKLLSPRWRHNPYFWPDLLRYGSSGDLQHFKFAHLLGSQLMAQDLEPSAILHLSNTETD